MAPVDAQQFSAIKIQSWWKKLEQAKVRLYGPVDDLTVEERNVISHPDHVQPLQPQAVAPAASRSSLVTKAHDEAVRVSGSSLFGRRSEIVIRILLFLLDTADKSFMSPGNYTTFNNWVNLNTLSRCGHHIVQRLTRTVPLSLPMIVRAASDYMRTQFKDNVLWPVSRVVRNILQNAGWEFPSEYICPFSNHHDQYNYNRVQCRALALPQTVWYHDDFVDDHPRSFEVNLEQLYNAKGKKFASSAACRVASSQWAALWRALSPLDRVKIWHEFVCLIGQYTSREAYAVMDEEEAAQNIQEAE